MLFRIKMRKNNYKLTNKQVLKKISPVESTTGLIVVCVVQ